MLLVSMLHEEDFDDEERVRIYSDVIRDVVKASKLYKRKTKKTRNSAIQAPNARRKKVREANIIVKSPSEAGYDSDSSSAFEDKEQAEDEPKPNVVVEVKQEGIRDLLKDAGVLKEQPETGKDNQSMIQFSSRSSFKSYS